MNNRPDLTKYKGVFFDLDGTLVDSISVWNNADENLVRQLGATLRQPIADELKEFQKQNTSPKKHLYVEYSQYLIDALGIKNITAEKFWELAKETSAEMLCNLPYKDYADKLLLALKERGTALGLVTKTTSDVLENYIYKNERIKNTAPFGSVFGDNIVASDMVKKQKPHPEPYLMAVEKLGLHPKECLAFEDSLEGTQSALGAGMDVCVVYDKHSDKDRGTLQKLTTFHVEDFGELFNDLNKQKLCRLLNTIRVKKENARTL